MLPSKTKHVLSVRFAKSSGLFQYQTNIPTDSSDELSVSGARDDESWIFGNRNFSFRVPFLTHLLVEVFFLQVRRGPCLEFEQ